MVDLHGSEVVDVLNMCGSNSEAFVFSGTCTVHQHTAADSLSPEFPQPTVRVDLRPVIVR